MQFLLAFWTLTLIGTVAPWHVGFNLVCAVANGLAISLLFGIGHGTCHRIFVPGKRLNLWLTRLLFIPVAHSASLWDLVHKHVVRTCKLYDFEHQRWLDFSGRPTSSALRPEGRR